MKKIISVFCAVLCLLGSLSLADGLAKIPFCLELNPEHVKNIMLSHDVSNEMWAITGEVKVPRNLTYTNGVKWGVVVKRQEWVIMPIPVTDVQMRAILGDEDYEAISYIMTLGEYIPDAIICDKIIAILAY